MAELKNELNIVKRRNEILALSDSAISEGSVASYRKLEELAANTSESADSNIALTELFKVFQAYSPGAPSRIDGLNIKVETINPAKKEASELSIEEIFDALSELQKTPEIERADLGRAKFTQLLNKKHKEFSFGDVESLVILMRNETHLEAIRQMREVFGNASNYHQSGKLDASDALLWWEKNKDDIRARLQKTP